MTKNPSETTPSVTAGQRGRSEILKTATLVLVIALCSVSCALMLSLAPHTLAVDSVYAGF